MCMCVYVYKCTCVFVDVCTCVLCLGGGLTYEPLKFEVFLHQCLLRRREAISPYYASQIQNGNQCQGPGPGPV